MTTPRKDGAHVPFDDGLPPLEPTHSGGPSMSAAPMPSGELPFHASDGHRGPQWFDADTAGVPTGLPDLFSASADPAPSPTAPRPSPPPISDAYAPVVADDSPKVDSPDAFSDEPIEMPSVSMIDTPSPFAKTAPAHLLGRKGPKKKKRADVPEPAPSDPVVGAAAPVMGADAPVDDVSVDEVIEPAPPPTKPPPVGEGGGARDAGAMEPSAQSGSPPSPSARSDASRRIAPPFDDARIRRADDRSRGGRSTTARDATPNSRSQDSQPRRLSQDSAPRMVSTGHEPIPVVFAERLHTVTVALVAAERRATLYALVGFLLGSAATLAGVAVARFL